MGSESVWLNCDTSNVATRVVCSMVVVLLALRKNWRVHARVFHCSLVLDASPYATDNHRETLRISLTAPCVDKHTRSNLCEMVHGYASWVHSRDWGQLRPCAKRSHSSL